MPNVISPTNQLSQLNSETEQGEAESSRLENERRALAKATARAGRRSRYLRFVRWFRRPAKSFELWNTGVLLAGPAVVAVLFFVLADLLFNSFALALLTFIVGFVGGTGLIATLLYSPANALLEPSIVDAEAKWRLESARLTEKIQRLAEVNQRLQRLVEERRALVASDKFRRAVLLQRNWKAMRSDEWEDYLVEVCRALGATVQRTGKTGDQGCDLVVEFGPRRIAVQAKGYYNSVNNKAVQEVVASRAHYGCSDAVVITNSRFTPSAKELAESNDCKLIGEDKFPDFVMGKIEL